MSYIKKEGKQNTLATVENRWQWDTLLQNVQMRDNGNLDY